MKGYVDSSAALRAVFDEPGRIDEWGDVEPVISSVLTRLECLRAVDRRRAQDRGTPDEISSHYAAIRSLLNGFDLVALDRVVLDRAALPLPLPLGSLDAIHLATALLWQESSGEPVAMVTHDPGLANAAIACGLRVLGVPPR